MCVYVWQSSSFPWNCAYLQLIRRRQMFLVLSKGGRRVRRTEHPATILCLSEIKATVPSRSSAQCTPTTAAGGRWQIGQCLFSKSWFDPADTIYVYHLRNLLVLFGSIDQLAFYDKPKNSSWSYDFFACLDLYLLGPPLVLHTAN